MIDPRRAGGEVRRVCELVAQRLAEHEERDGGVYTQAAAIIDVLRAIGRVGNSAKKVEAMFLKMWSAVELGPIPHDLGMDGPPLELLELAKDSVARAVRDAKASSNVLVPVLCEWIVIAAANGGPGNAPGFASWMLARLTREESEYELEEQKETLQLVRLH